MSMDIKLSEAQISEIIQSGGFIVSWLVKLDKQVVTDISIPFAKNRLPDLVSNIASDAASNAINKFERRTSLKGAVRVGKVLTLFILNEDMDVTINIVKLSDNSAVLIDGVTKAVKHKIKKQEGTRFLYLLRKIQLCSLIPLELNIFCKKY